MQLSTPEVRWITGGQGRGKTAPSSTGHSPCTVCPRFPTGCPHGIHKISTEFSTDRRPHPEPLSTRISTDLGVSSTDHEDLSTSNPQKKFLSTAIHRQSTAVIHDLGITRRRTSKSLGHNEMRCQALARGDRARRTTVYLGLGAIPAGRAGDSACGAPRGKTCGSAGQGVCLIRFVSSAIWL